MPSRKKYNPQKNRDIINPLEWVGSSYNGYMTRLVDSVKTNKFLIEDLVLDFVQLHRFTFFPCDYDFSSPRKIIEKLFSKYLIMYDLSNVEKIRKRKIRLYKPQQDILVEFIQVIRKIIFSYKSRYKFTKDNAEMISSHNAYCALIDDNILRFENVQKVKDAQEDIRLKLHEKEISKALKNKQQVFVDETGDIFFEVSYAKSKSSISL